MLRWCRPAFHADGHSVKPYFLQRLSISFFRHAAHQTFEKPALRAHKALLFAPFHASAIAYGTRNKEAPVKVGDHQRRPPIGFDDSCLAPSSLPSCSSSSTDFNGDGSPSLELCPADVTPEKAFEVLGLSRYLESGMPLNGASINVVFSAYKQVKHGPGLRALTSRELSNLISAFGTTSLPANSLSCVYHSCLISCFTNSLAPSEYWSTVVELLDAKVSMGYTLCSQDRYWHMRALLAQAELLKGGQGNLSLAMVHYEHLHERCFDLEVHLPLFKMLLASKSDVHVNLVAHYTSQLLRRMTDLFPELVGIFWKLVLDYDKSLADTSREKLCSVIFQRIGETHPTISPLSPQYQGQPLHLSHLANFLTTSVFSSHPQPNLPQSVVSWARQTVEDVFFAPPLPIRWANLRFLGGYLNVTDGWVPANRWPTSSPAQRSSIYFTVLDLNAVCRALSHGSYIGDRTAEALKPVLRSLWGRWITTSQKMMPTVVDEVVIFGFLRLLVVIRDHTLFVECFDYCKPFFREAVEELTPNRLDIVAALVQASRSIRQDSWNAVFGFVAHIFHRQSWRNEVIERLLCHYSSSDVDTAFDLYLYTRSSHYMPTVDTMHYMAIAFSQHCRWSHLTHLLDQPFTLAQQRSLLEASLRTIQTQRLEYVNVRVIDWIGETVGRLYASDSPPPNLQYPIRYLLSILVRLGRPAIAVKLAKNIQNTSLAFFSPVLIRRLVVQLLEVHQPRLAVSLYQVFASSLSASWAQNIQQKLSLRLCTMRSWKVVRSGIYRARQHRGRRRLASLTLSSTRPIWHLRSSLIDANEDPRETISQLVRARRIFAARNLLRRMSSHLDPSTHATLCNIVLHGSISHRDLRGRHRLRHVLNMKESLQKRCQFVPDRATINILLKAMLQWDSMFDAPRLRHLFDQMVHEGYPVPDRFRFQHNVPFGHPRAVSETSVFPSLSSHVSFTKHVRPMYKMFIKAFYRRRDTLAAKRLVGILKAAEVVDREEREKRNRARREGIIKKRAKLARLRDEREVAL